jgi:lipopolysaccharide transport system permease protein
MGRETTVRSSVYRSNGTASTLDALNDLFERRELLLAWTVREVTVRYKQSLLGVAWAILQPLSMMLVFSVIFTYVVRIPTQDVPYPLFSYVALVPWTFLSTSLQMGSASIVNNMGLVTKVRFPREVLPLAQVGAAGFDSLVASTLLVALMLFYRVNISWTILAVPVLLAMQLALLVGATLLLSAVTVRFRDIRFVVPVALQLWMYATPIIYPLSLVPEQWRWLIRLNPMTTIIEGYRSVLLYSQLPSAFDVALASGVSILILAVGYTSFRRIEIWFADIM